MKKFVVNVELSEEETSDLTDIVWLLKGYVMCQRDNDIQNSGEIYEGHFVTY